MHIEIRIDAEPRLLNEWLLLNTHHSWAFLTAWNPVVEETIQNGGTNESLDIEPHPLQDNIRNNRHLFSALREEGFIVLPAWGIPDRPNWPPEASFLVLGIDKEEASRVAREFHQYAFVYGEYSPENSKEDNHAQLVMLEGEPKAVYKETTYMVAPLYPEHPSSFEVWLHGIGGRSVRLSETPFVDSIFQMPYRDGYLGWFE
jgi:hypothetical protein